MRKLVIILSATLFLAGCDSTGDEYTGYDTSGGLTISYSITIENLSDCNISYYFYKDENFYEPQGYLKAVSYSNVYGHQGERIIDSVQHKIDSNSGELGVDTPWVKIETKKDGNTIIYSIVRDEDYVFGGISR